MSSYGKECNRGRSLSRSGDSLHHLARGNSPVTTERMMQKYEDHPLINEVPGHLFQFEEKIFGMTLQQLLSDIGAGVGIVSLTGSLPLVTRIVVCALLALPMLILVHGKVQDQTFLHWLYLY